VRTYPCRRGYARLGPFVKKNPSILSLENPCKHTRSVIETDPGVKLLVSEQKFEAALAEVEKVRAARLKRAGTAPHPATAGRRAQPGILVEINQPEKVAP
jgi:hypothetical protein